MYKISVKLRTKSLVSVLEYQLFIINLQLSDWLEVKLEAKQDIVLRSFETNLYMRRFFQIGRVIWPD